MANYKKSELVEKAEEQISTDASNAFDFLGKAMNAVLGIEEKPKPKLISERSGYPSHPQELICKTCGGEGEVGREGYKVSCPSCKPNNCKTCRGSGTLGTIGYEVKCPMCQIEGR